jgi:uncharacterized protein (TIGR02118 family)
MMIKLSVMYPYSEDAQFDHAYYRDVHMPMLKERMGDYCKYYSIDKGLDGVTPGTPPAYIAICHVVCDSVESLMAGIGAHAAELAADIANFTNVTPVQQISEVVIDGAGFSRNPI